MRRISKLGTDGGQDLDVATGVCMNMSGQVDRKAVVEQSGKQRNNA